MDAHAHLLSLGWAGPGHSLDSKPYKQKGHRGLAYDPAKVGNNGTGLVKPLSLSQRQGRFGIGKKAHEPQAGNEWWLKGFESALGNIGKSESERSSGTSTPIARVHSGKHGGLYGFFIKGQEMRGTIGDSKDMEQSSKKRKSDVLDESARDKSSEQQKNQTTSEFEQAGTFFALRDTGEQHERRIKRATAVEEFEQVGKFLQARTEKHNKKKRESETIESEVSTPLQNDRSEGNEPGHIETKEERRERRRLQRDQKEQRRRALTTLENQQDRGMESAIDMEDPATRAARKAERKRRKAEEAL